MKKLKEVQAKQAYNHIKGSKAKAQVQFHQENFTTGRARKTFMRDFRNTDDENGHLEREDDPHELYQEYKAKHEAVFGKEKKASRTRVQAGSDHKENIVVT